jgi:hypothetical protein
VRMRLQPDHRRPLRLVTLLFAIALTACGGRVAGEDDGNGDGDAGTDADSASADGLPADSTAIDTGVPLDGGPCSPVYGLGMCGAACGSCGADQRCTGFDDIEFKGSFQPGVCVPPGSSPFYGDDEHTCPVCASETDLCVMTDLATFVCVPATLCRQLTPKGSVGTPSPCVYQDVTRWSPSDTLATGPCPAGGAGMGLCGGACGACGSEQVCVGRSATKSFGVCADRKVNIPGVGLRTNSCGLGASCRTPGYRCLTHRTTVGRLQEIADLYGFCVPTERCDALAKTFSASFICK